MNFTHLLPTVAGICGSMFVGYCVYFDRKRRSAADFKKKLHERRNPKSADKKKAVLSFPNLDDALACQKFLMLELGKASKCMDEDKIDDAFTHLANSLSVCDDEKRTYMLLLFQEKYPPVYIQAIIQRIPEAEKRLRDYHSNGQGEKKESKVNTRFPCTTDKEACYKFVTEEIALANKCAENGDFSGASYHYANVVVIVDETEKQEILTQLRQSLGMDFFLLVLQATGSAQNRLREKLVHEDQGLALNFLISLSLLYILVRTMFQI